MGQASKSASWIQIENAVVILGALSWIVILVAAILDIVFGLLYLGVFSYGSWWWGFGYYATGYGVWYIIAGAIELVLLFVYVLNTFVPKCKARDWEFLLNDGIFTPKFPKMLFFGILLLVFAPELDYLGGILVVVPAILIMVLAPASKLAPAAETTKNSFSNYLKKAKELDAKAQKCIERDDFSQARLSWEECIENYQKALKLKPRDLTSESSLDPENILRESIFTVRQNILNSHTLEADALDKQAIKDYENEQFDNARGNWEDLEKTLSDAITYAKSYPELEIETDDITKKLEDTGYQLNRVNIAITIQDAEALIEEAKEKKTDNPEEAIERVNKALVSLRQAFTSAKEINDSSLIDRITGTIKKGMELHQDIQNELNELMGLPRILEATKLQSTKDFIDELDKQFAEWGSKEKSKEDKI